MYLLSCLRRCKLISGEHIGHDAAVTWLFALRGVLWLYVAKLYNDKVVGNMALRGELIKCTSALHASS